MISLKNLNIYNKDINTCVDEFIKDAKDSRACNILSCINTHSYVIAKRDISFAAALKKSKWLIPDGIGIVMASKLFPKTIKNRLTGPDFYDSTMKKLNEAHGSVAFIGSTEENLKEIRIKVNKNYPNIKILTMISPPFQPEFKGEINDSMINKINIHSPDILWVGMTAPKQEKWIFDNQKKLSVGAVAAVGAVFDFAAGNIARAPLWMQRYNLEWLHRFAKNPLRLSSRIFISIPMFFLYIAYEKLFL